uniref:Uncharacterized protein n=1 Tax=Anguilla anguilla TaxID=7936 RepID=A0A0E9T1Z8_ANGAN
MQRLYCDFLGPQPMINCLPRGQI